MQILKGRTLDDRDQLRLPVCLGGSDCDYWGGGANGLLCRTECGADAAELGRTLALLVLLRR